MGMEGLLSVITMLALWRTLLLLERVRWFWRVGSKCSTSVPEEEISQRAGQQEMADTHTPRSTPTHVYGVICDGKGRQVWAMVLVVW